MRKFDWLKGACAALVLCLATAIVLPAQTFTTLHRFDGSDGSDSWAGLVQATDGNLYGTTVSGGTNDAGTVFRITPKGTQTVLYSFCSQSDCADGEWPYAELIQGTDGNLYGTTSWGGANASDGTVFKITPSGTLTTLYSFCSQSNCADGRGQSGLVQATDGNFYGTTYYGGSSNKGTVFRITPSGTFTTLYGFCSRRNCTDGSKPEAGLVQAANGNFYGTTEAGGASGNGTVFKITPSGSLTTLYGFCSQSGCADGSDPEAALVQAADGSLYGTTRTGGANGSGTVFRITPTGTMTTLYSFCSQSYCTDGGGPEAPLMQANDGSLYGITLFGGSTESYAGTVFEITPTGTLTTLYNFCSQSGCTDGESLYGSYAGLVQDTNGTFYGTTSIGGNDVCNGGGCGTVFSLAMGLTPFVETSPSFGPVGRSVKILGTNLTGATSVTFNGTAAIFKVGSPSLIMATVPEGATTGTVQVVTPSGTLSSNVPFRVRQ